MLLEGMVRSLPDLSRNDLIFVLPGIPFPIGPSCHDYFGKYHSRSTCLKYVLHIPICQPAVIEIPHVTLWHELKDHRLVYHRSLNNQYRSITKYHCPMPCIQQGPTDFKPSFLSKASCAAIFSACLGQRALRQLVDYGRPRPQSGRCWWLH